MSNTSNKLASAVLAFTPQTQVTAEQAADITKLVQATFDDLTRQVDKYLAGSTSAAPLDGGGEVVIIITGPPPR